MGLWYWITAEFKALGLRCVAHGPEFWLVVPLALGLAAGVVIAACDIWRGGHK
jgi:hypothetical protein